MSVWCNSHYSDRAELRDIPIQAKRTCPTLALAPSTYGVRQNSSHMPAHILRSPKKRLRPRSPTPRASTKPYTAPVDPETTSLVTTSFLVNPSLRDPLCHTRPPGNMKFPPWIESLRPEKIATLREENECDVRLGRISDKALRHWESQNPGVLVDENLRYEYNFLSENLIIKCMPTAVHDSVGRYFVENVSDSLKERFGRPQVRTLVIIGSGTTFTGFMGDENGFSQKLPDGYVKPVDALFPTVVCEAGFAESMEDLQQDARLWLLNTGGTTRVVIVVCMKEIIATEVVSGNMEKRHTSDAEEMAGDGQVPGIPYLEGSGVGETAANGQALGIHDPEGSCAEKTAGDGQALGIRDSEGTDEETTLLNSIDQTTQHNSLVKQLLELNHRAKLKRPLLGGLEATIHLYRAAEDNTDIVEAFTATLLPQPPANSPEPKEFSIPLHDILGTSARPGEPSEEIVFALGVLREFIESSIPDTEHFRAVNRAKKLLKSRVGLDDEEETFAKRKRRRLSPIGIWK